MYPLVPLVLAAQVVLGNPGITALNSGARAIDRNDIGKGLELTQQALDSDMLGHYETAKAFNNLCVAYYKLKLYDEALKHCDEAISISQRNWTYFNNRAGVHLGLGRQEEAVADYRKALDLNPDSERLKQNLQIAFRTIERAGNEPDRPDT